MVRPHAHATRAAQLRATFDRPAPLTVGLEEETMLLDPETLELAPVAGAVVSASRLPLKRELPAAQVELVTPPSRDVPEAIAVLRRGRGAVDEAARAVGARAVGVGAAPVGGAEAELSAGERYARVAARFGTAVRRQQVAALQVHVCVRGADRALAVHDALRGFLPELAALAANAPFHLGADSGFASVRPTITTLLPRQGVPPALGSWEALAEALAWTGDDASWWWELRLHPVHGTLELRVPDTPATVADAEAIAGVAHALVAWLVERHDAGERLPVFPSWQIAENRAAAYVHGVGGTLRDLATGIETATAERLSGLLDELAEPARRIGAGGALTAARALLGAGGGAGRQRAAAGGDARAAAAWLIEHYAS